MSPETPEQLRFLSTDASVSLKHTAVLTRGVSLEADLPANLFGREGHLATAQPQAQVARSADLLAAITTRDVNTQTPAISPHLGFSGLCPWDGVAMRR